MPLVKLSLQCTGGIRSFECEENITGEEITDRVTKLTGIPSECFFLVHHGRIMRNSHTCTNGTVYVLGKLLGGKGGFGSMLRAIGAQIEKTTNREACRDLSGRRLRDINEEKRLKSWIDKQASREEEAVERKKKKLERLCAQPKHEFKDKNYEKERSNLTEKVGDAVEEGFKLAMAAGSSGIKRKSNDAKDKPKRKKLDLHLDLGIESDESCTDSTDSLDSVEIEPRNIETKGKEKRSDENQTPLKEKESSDTASNSKSCADEIEEEIPNRRDSEKSANKVAVVL